MMTDEIALAERLAFAHEQCMAAVDMAPSEAAVYKHIAWRDAGQGCADAVRDISAALHFTPQTIYSATRSLHERGFIEFRIGKGGRKRIWFFRHRNGRCYIPQVTTNKEK